ncbi:hypothetical protein ACROYT_G020075 [Oculina patagonica]
MYVKFKSDTSGTFKGFNISVSAVEAVESYGMCRVSAKPGKVYWPNGSSGMLYTPDYPIPYPAGTNCFWIITVPTGKRVKLTFEDFELEKNSFNTGYSNCKYDQIEVYRDYVEMRDGPWSNSRDLGVYCGNKLGFKFYSTGHQMWIKFRSAADGSGQSKGFKAHFEAVEPIVSEELCLPGNTNNDNLKLTGSDGTLQSPLVYYPPDLNCDWLITVPEGNTVELSFDAFDLDFDGATGACKGDYVDILDGQDSDSKSHGKFCGYKFPGTIRSSGRYMRVRFKSDSKGPVYKGFKATFSAESSSTMLTLVIVILIVVILLALLVGCILYLVKRKKTPDSEAGAAIRMSAITTPASHTTQAGVTEHTPSAQVPDQRAETPYSTPQVGFAPGTTDPLLPSPERPDTLPENPPPYSGEEDVPQYPPPGKS